MSVCLYMCMKRQVLPSSTREQDATGYSHIWTMFLHRRRASHLSFTRKLVLEHSHICLLGLCLWLLCATLAEWGVFAGEVAHPFRACNIYCLTLCRAIFLFFSVVRTHREAVRWLKPSCGFQILNFKPESSGVAVLSLFFTIIFKLFGKFLACILDL